MTDRLAVLALWLGVTGCELECEKQGCDDDGLYFHIDGRTGSEWSAEQDAVYDIDLVLDSTTVRCEGTLAEGIYCNDGWVRLDVWESSSGAAEIGGIEVRVQEGGWPAEVAITISRDDDVVFEQSYDIEPELDYPNGKRCGDPCEFWSASIDW